MKRLLIVLLLASPVLAQDGLVEQHERTSVFGGRWELLQSTLVARITMKVDKFTGKVWQIVRNTDDNLVWQLIPFDHFRPAKPTNKISFQLFTSGTAARHTYLLQIHTGISWQLVKDKEGNSVWQYVKSF